MNYSAIAFGFEETLSEKSKLGKLLIFLIGQNNCDEQKWVRNLRPENPADH